jgi:hypothetical protein
MSCLGQGLGSCHAEWPLSRESTLPGSRPLLAACRRAPTPRRNNDAYHRATLPSVAVWCIAFGRPAFGNGPATDLQHADLGHLAICAATNRHPPYVTLSLMDQNLCRRLMPRPKFGRSRPTTAAAAPTTFRLVHLQVVGRKQMAITAEIGCGHGLEDTLQGKADHIGIAGNCDCPVSGNPVKDLEVRSWPVSVARRNAEPTAHNELMPRCRMLQDVSDRCKTRRNSRYQDTGGAIQLKAAPRYHF